MASPEVLIARMAKLSAANPCALASRCRTSCACASASGLPRVPMVATIVADDGSVGDCTFGPRNATSVLYLSQSSCAGLTRASISRRTSPFKEMDCRVKPGNDDKDGVFGEGKRSFAAERKSELARLQ